jgi:hypothetical protein
MRIDKGKPKKLNIDCCTENWSETKHFLFPASFGCLFAESFLNKPV